MTDNGFPEKLTLTYELQQQLRYGENHQQRAALYRAPLAENSALVNAKQLQGKELSYNNFSDAGAALRIVREFERPAAVAVKHSNPCGVGGWDAQWKKRLAKRSRRTRFPFSEALWP